MKEALVVQMDRESVYLMTDNMKIQRIRIGTRGGIRIGERIPYRWYDLLPWRRVIFYAGACVMLLLFGLVLVGDGQDNHALQIIEEKDAQINEIIIEVPDTENPSIYYVRSPFEQGEMMKQRQLISSKLKRRNMNEIINNKTEEETSHIKINLVDEEKP